MPKIIALVGPTASGKTNMSIQIAKLFNCEIINMDAYQVYKELNIGTSKITEEEKENIPHHLLNIISYKDKYSIYVHQKLVRQCISEIIARNHIPLLVGGTGLYIKACIYDYTFQENVLEESYDKFSNDELYEMLKQVDPNSLNTIHINNRKRLIRAINISKNGLTKSEIENEQTHQPIYDCLFLGIDVPREELHKRIETRIKKMFELGLENEVHNLMQNPEFKDSIASKAIGYKEFFISDNPFSDILIHTRQFAKRQMTWFRHQFHISWISTVNEANDLIKEFIYK